MLPKLRSYLMAGIALLLLGSSVANGQAVVPTATLTVNGTEQGESANIEVDFNGFVEIVGYGQYSTNASLASALAAMFVRDYHSFGLYAKAAVNPAQPNVVTFQLINGSSFAPLNVVGPTTSFTLWGSGFGSSSATTADIGVATLTVNGAIVAKANYGSGSTAASIAQDLSSLASSPLVAVTSEGPNVYLQAKQTSGSFSFPYSLTFSTTQSFGTSTPAGGSITSSAATGPITVYSYCVGPVNPCPTSGGTSGYQANGNIQNLSDSVMGNWTYGYDSLNRLTSGTAAGGPYNGGSTCWTYDSFGNRLSQSVSTTPCGSNPPSTFAATYSSNNQISAITTPSHTVMTYDAAGNVTNDGVNTYTFDAEGRVCALNGPQGMIGYQYDADGNRVGKGSVTNWQSCDITQNGYQPMTDYVLDQGGSQMTEISVVNNTSAWVHSNVMADGALIATLDTTGFGTHFYLNDALGTRRVQTDPAGVPEQTCQSLPFGDQLYCTGSIETPTEHHFTGKERDTESGLDYFGARYYASNMGRWMSPDWAAKAEPVPYAKLDDPQSLNLYAYVRNNPLSRADVDGHEWEESSMKWLLDAKRNLPAGIIAGPPPKSGPRFPLPNGKNGKTNQWVKKTPSGNGPNPRGEKWGPEWPVASPTGTQPQASWDDRDGKSGTDHWDIDGVAPDRVRVTPDGRSITPDQAHGMTIADPDSPGAPYPRLLTIPPGTDQVVQTAEVGVIAVVIGAIVAWGALTH